MKRKSILFVLALALFAALGNVGSTRDFAVGAVLEDFKLTDINGAEQSLGKLKGEKGTILVFLSAQCPVVKSYNARVSAIAKSYKAKGINVVGINSNATESLEWVKSHATENYDFPMLIDKGNVIADKLGANVTPEVYFLDENNKLLYKGAIDNDRSGNNPTNLYLQDAVDARLAGKAIAKTSANAFGCSIKRAAATKN
ncbi:MAG TPA: redoxin domain-containing protein [Pyrinomonadaceae bacterium]|nr:redoxin domain-containing protein [Pyrinomonadaceae bacterium]